MKKKMQVQMVLSFVLIFFLMSWGRGAWASEPYPTKPIKLLIPFAPGGGTDVTIRTIDKGMPKYLTQRLILTNRPGGHGSICMTELVNSKSDGYTICIASSGPTTTVPHMEKVAYKLDDYVPIIQLTSVPNLLVAHPEAPFNSLKDILDYAQKNPPGAIKAAISGIGSPTSHLPLVQLEQQAGIKFSMIPFKSGGEAAVAVMGKHAPIGNLDLMATLPKIKAGSLKAIAVLDKKRLETLPNVPTLKEQGYHIEGSFFNMIIAPRGTPEECLKILHDAFKKALEDKEFLALAEKLDLKIEYLDGKGCRERINKDYETIGALIEQLKLGKK